MGQRASQELVVLTIFALAIPSGSAASPSQSTCIDYENYLHVVGTLDTPHQPSGIVLQGDLAYVADEDAGLLIVDVSDPAHLSILGTADTPGIARGVAISGELACVADGSFGLAVINVADPAHPQIVGQLDTEGTAYSVAIVGHHAYLADGSNGLVIVDLSTPTAPSLVGHADTPGTAYELVVVNPWIYVADGIADLQIIDASNMTSPLLASSLDNYGDAYSVALFGNRAFLPKHYPGPHGYDSTGSLDVIDVADPRFPSTIGSIDFGYSPASEVVVDATYAYVSAGQKVQIVDVQDPNSMSVIARIGTGGNPPRDLALSPTCLFTATFQYGVYAVDLRTLEMPPLLGQADAWSTQAMAVAGDHVYMATREDGFRVINIEDPDAPRPLDSFVGIGGGDVAIAGSFAFVPYDGLHSIAIADPSDPVLLATLQLPGIADAVDLDGPIALVAAREAGVHIVDASNPEDLQLLGSVDTPGNATDVIVAAGLVFVADGTAGIQVVDFEDPQNPTIVGTLATPSIQLAVAGDVLCSQGWRRFVTIDLANPRNPALLGQLYLGGSYYDIEASQATAYVVGDAGLVVIDLSNVAAPRIIGAFDAPSGLTAAAITPTHLLAADFRSTVIGFPSIGLVTLPLQCEGTTAVVSTPSIRGSQKLAVFPNPGFPTTTVQFQTPQRGFVSAQIYDVGGRLIRNLRNEVFEPGVHQLTWDGRNDAASLAASGMYWVRVATTHDVQSQRFTILR